jgi:hypothetical protein
MNIDWCLFTLSSIDNRYQNGTEMRSAMRAKFGLIHRQRMHDEVVHLAKVLLPLHYSMQTTLAMVNATIPAANRADAVVTDEDIESVVGHLQKERFDRVFHNRKKTQEEPPPSSVPVHQEEPAPQSDVVSSSAMAMSE